MNPRTKVLKQLVRDSQYVVDPDAVAEAIILRARAQQVLPDMTFRSAPAPRAALSLRPDRGARSFRLTHTDRRSRHQPGDDADSSSPR
jgi:hypothetical protein